MKALTALIALAIAFVVFTSPEREQLPAQQETQVKSVQVSMLEELLQSEVRQSGEIEQIADVVSAIDTKVGKHWQETHTKLVTLESKVAEVEADKCDCNCADLEKRVAVIESKLATYASVGAGAPASYGSVGSSPTTTQNAVGYGSVGSSTSTSVGYGSVGSSAASTPRTPLRSAVGNVAGNVASRWENRDGLSRRDHLEIEHGTNTAGMTEAQMIAAQNAYHDTYGGGHPVKVPYAPVASDGCPPGGCPVPSSRAYQASSNGWWLGKNLGRKQR